jgi:hypothetical protein
LSTPIPAALVDGFGNGTGVLAAWSSPPERVNRKPVQE